MTSSLFKPVSSSSSSSSSSLFATHSGVVPSALSSQFQSTPSGYDIISGKSKPTTKQQHASPSRVQNPNQKITADADLTKNKEVPTHPASPIPHHITALSFSSPSLSSSSSPSSTSFSSGSTVSLLEKAHVDWIALQNGYKASSIRQADTQLLASEHLEHTVKLLGINIDTLENMTKLVNPLESVMSRILQMQNNNLSSLSKQFALNEQYNQWLEERNKAAKELKTAVTAAKEEKPKKPRGPRKAPAKKETKPKTTRANKKKAIANPKKKQKGNEIDDNHTVEVIDLDKDDSHTTNETQEPHENHHPDQDHHKEDEDEEHEDGEGEGEDEEEEEGESEEDEDDIEEDDDDDDDEDDLVLSKPSKRKPNRLSHPASDNEDETPQPQSKRGKKKEEVPMEIAHFD